MLAFLLAISISWPSVIRAQHKKIAVFGSSVAKGSGDTTGTGGYAGMIKTMLEQRGWTVVNVSRGGDNTIKILPRFENELLPEKPGYVIIGLSLGNEGITARSALNRDRIFERFRSGMAHLVKLCRNNGMIPVVVNCYTRNDFGPEQYDAIRKMNLIMNTWDVPGINALGAIDDGTGKWAEGCWHDKSHPNEKGHREIFYAFVPGLFDAIESGKGVPEKIRTERYLTVVGGTDASPLVYIPDDSIHSFTVSFLVKSHDEGVVAVLEGRHGNAIVSLKNGRVMYQNSQGESFSADTVNETNGWQYVVLGHRYATGMTTFFVNGKIAGSHSGQLDFRQFILGGSGHATQLSPQTAGYKDLLIYRSALNADEIKALYNDQLLTSSLEIYAPLDDPEFIKGTRAGNHAQSTSMLMINSSSMVSAVEEKAAASK